MKIVSPLLIAAIVLAAPAANAQTAGKKKAVAASAKKPAAATPPAGKQTIVLGTQQLPGDFGQFGQTYTIGKDSPLNFTLNRAEYSAARFVAGDTTCAPEAGQKLLVLHFTVQNPRPQQQAFYGNSVTFTAVDRKDVNHEGVEHVSREGARDDVQVELKPGQKLDVQAVIVVPEDGVIPKLIVKRQEGAPVIRYDLRGKVQPLPAPFADPADPAGATFAKMVTGQAGTFYPIGNVDVRFDGASYVAGALGGQEPEEGKRFLVVAATLRHATNQRDLPYGGTNFEAELRTADGEKADYAQMLKASKDERLESTLSPGEELKVRFVFLVDKGAEVKTVGMREGLPNGMSHTYAFDVSGAK